MHIFFLLVIFVVCILSLFMGINYRGNNRIIISIKMLMSMKKCSAKMYWACATEEIIITVGLALFFIQRLKTEFPLQCKRSWGDD